MITSTDLLRDIRSEFLLTYRRQVGRSKNLSLGMSFVPSTKNTERYGYWESAPHLERWDRNEKMAEDELLGRSYSVQNLDWAKAIGFHENDVEDVQLEGFRERARMLAGRAAKIPQDVYFQIKTGATNAALLKSIPTAPDGAALYAATAGGAARFGVTGGNILTGSEVASGDAVRADFWSAMERFRLFQDTEGEELLDDEIEAGVLIEFNANLEEVFHEAFKQERTVQIVQNVAGAENVASSAVTNTIRERGLPITLWPTQKITDNDWTVTLTSPLDPSRCSGRLARARASSRRPARTARVPAGRSAWPSWSTCAAPLGSTCPTGPSGSTTPRTTRLQPTGAPRQPGKRIPCRPVSTKWV